MKTIREIAGYVLGGMSFGYETMGQGNSMITISISGTAVVID